MLNINYKLTPDDIYTFFRDEHAENGEIKRKIVYSVLILICVTVSVVNYFMKSADAYYLMGVGAVGVFVLLLIWALPVAERKKIAKRSGSDEELKAVFYEDKAEIGEGENMWSFEYKDIAYTVRDDRITFYVSKSNVIPVFTKYLTEDQKKQLIELMKSSEAREDE